MPRKSGVHCKGEEKGSWQTDYCTRMPRRRCVKAKCLSEYLGLDARWIEWHLAVFLMATAHNGPSGIILPLYAYTAGCTWGFRLYYFARLLRALLRRLKFQLYVGAPACEYRVWACFLSGQPWFAAEYCLSPSIMRLFSVPKLQIATDTFLLIGIEG